MIADRFEPYGELARVLLPLNDAAGNGSHDGSHLARVWRNARAMQREEGGDLELLAAAALLGKATADPSSRCSSGSQRSGGKDLDARTVKGSIPVWRPDYART